MQYVENLNPVPPLHNRKNIAHFIDQSLLGDWAIRVEYTGYNAQGKIAWLQWGSTKFAINSPEVVMESIDNCHASFPAQNIRISAEKINPETRMVYNVYRCTNSDVN